MVKVETLTEEELDALPQIIDALDEMGERPKESDFATFQEVQEIWEILDNTFQDLVDLFGEKLVFYAQEQVAALRCGICGSKERGHYHQTMEGAWMKAPYGLEP
jgi:hypothetical protein